MRVEQIGAATQWVRIYALCEPDWRVRYVGKTVQYLHERHKAHISTAKRGSHLPVYFWLRKQIAASQPLCIRLLENVDGAADWQERERFWIARFRTAGELLNLTDGGEGIQGHTFSPEHRERIAARLRTGAFRPCEVCGKPLWAKRHEIKQGHGRFCSRACSNHRHKGRSLFDG